jgi:MFS family permease
VKVIRYALGYTVPTPLIIQAAANASFFLLSCIVLQISLAFTLANVMFSVSSPLAGRLVDRLGARRVILPGTLIFGFLLISFKFISTNLWQSAITA